MNENSLKDLLDQYITGTITDEGKAKLADLLDQPKYVEQLNIILGESFRKDDFEGEENPEIKSAIQVWLHQKIKKEKQQPKIFNIGRMVAAATIILAFSAASYFYFSSGTSNKEIASRGNIKKIETDIAPGHEGAILTLSTGEVIVLDSAQNGPLVREGGVEIVKEDGQLNYEELSGAEVVYHTMSTPNGRQFSLLLADGSKVWLNAASSVTYPTSFTGSERKVAITGEAYFEVAHNPSQPFHVSVNGVEVQVLGTHFNINSYTDESHIRTTLLEGKVMVKKTDKDVILYPGQQATIVNGISEGNSIRIKNNVDVDRVMAWKNGIFNFENMAFDEVMRHLSRWYNLKVKYENGVPDFEIGGKMGRDVHLSKILEFFKKAGIKYRLDIESRSLTIIN